MSTYMIAGKECAFPSIPHSTLELYGPIQSTHIAMWRGKQPEDGLFLRVYLSMLSRIGAIERLYATDMEGGVTVALFDYVAHSGRILDDLANYLRILCGTAQLLQCPWRIATHQTYRDEWFMYAKMEADILELYQQKAAEGRPLPKSATHALLRLIDEDKETMTLLVAATAGDTQNTPVAHDGQQACLASLMSDSEHSKT